MRECHPLEELIRYEFQDQKYLDIALTHSSYANERKGHLSNNERQEFLGDSVLSIVVSDYLFHQFNVPEGELTKLRAALVCEKSLSSFADQIHLGQFLKLGKGEELTGGRTRPSILADAFEALIAAIYLDGGWAAAEEFLSRTLVEAEAPNYKTALQEYVQQRTHATPVYDSREDEDGFFCEVRALGRSAQGRGATKKLAEQAAARSLFGILTEQ